MRTAARSGATRPSSTNSAAPRWSEFAARLGGVGRLALIAVLVLAMTGPALAVLHGVDLEAPGATDYGRTAVAKATTVRRGARADALQPLGRPAGIAA